MSFSICLKCPRVQPPPYAGSCVCLEDGHDILSHADAAFCPLAKFGTSTAPAGWVTLTIDPSKFGKPPEQKPPEPIKPVPREEWPWWASSLAIFATDKDAGIGDIIHRLAGKIPAPILAAMKLAKMTWTGEPTCQCEAERAMYNQLYPL